MAKFKLQTAVKDISDYLNDLGIDGSYQYVGNENILIRSRHFKDNQELYDPEKSIVCIKGRNIPVEEVNDSHYPALVIKLEDLLRCKYQANVKKEISYNVSEVDGFDIIDEDCILDILKVEDIPLSIIAVEVSDRYLELEIDNIESVRDSDIYQAICPITTSSCIIDRTNSIVAVKIASVVEQMLPNRQIKIVNGKAFISKQIESVTEKEIVINK